MYLELQKDMMVVIPYQTNNYIDYLHRELWNCGKLRQGWGFKGLDLNLYHKDESKWIVNYVIGAKKYWDVDITDDYCHVACGRYNVLKHMKNANIGSIIFIPKHSYDKHHDEESFTVCKVIGPYYFDLDDKYKDFGHIISVKNIKSYKYSKQILLPGDFIGYRRGLGVINENHKLYKEKRFKRFMQEEFSIKL